MAIPVAWREYKEAEAERMKKMYWRMRNGSQGHDEVVSWIASDDDKIEIDDKNKMDWDEWDIVDVPPDSPPPNRPCRQCLLCKKYEVDPDEIDGMNAMRWLHKHPSIDENQGKVSPRTNTRVKIIN